jgi:hypothetical protein
MRKFKHKYMSDFAREHYAKGYEEGFAEGLAEVVLEVLERRGIEVSSDNRTRILSCSDVPRLRSWIRRSQVVTTADELFEPN